ncbi:MAG: hypothetical protein QOH05_803 [Acetobacteraceae bacterium]|jgi:hypothetical protein|nr:hypothetical protein [Acetobacteraceae bacterium]
MQHANEARRQATASGAKVEIASPAHGHFWYPIAEERETRESDTSNMTRVFALSDGRYQPDLPEQSFVEGTV